MATNNAVNISSQGTVYYNGTNAFSGLDASTSGFVLTSNGTGVAPSFQAIPALTTAVATRASGSALSLTTNTPANIVTLSIPSAGTWLTNGIVMMGGSPNISGIQQISISATSATHGTTGDNSIIANWTSPQFTVGNNFLCIPGYIITTVGATSIYLVATGNFNSGTMTAYGRLNALKIG